MKSQKLSSHVVLGLSLSINTKLSLGDNHEMSRKEVEQARVDLKWLRKGEGTSEERHTRQRKRAKEGLRQKNAHCA